MQNAKCKMQNEGNFSAKPKNILYILKINFDYRDVMFFKQFEKNFIVDEIKYNISVGVFDSVDG